PDVAMHDVETPGIGGEAIDRYRLNPVFAFGATAVGVVSVVVGLAGRDRRAPPERRRCPRPRRILPFRLGEQTVGLPGLARKPGQVLLGTVVPRHVDHRPVAAAPAEIIGIMRAATLPDASIPLVKRHLEPAHSEWPRKVHAMLRTLVIRAAR